MDELKILNTQLNRIRGMNKYYHQQFLLDVRILFFFTVIFWYLSTENSNAYYLLPIISLFGAVLLAFHAHYLIFSRNYSQFIEEKINKYSGKEILITHKLENSYLFPIQDKKLVVAKLGKNFTWFGFFTLFITIFGIFSYILAINKLLVMVNNQYYLIFLGVVTSVTLLFGIWWFLLGKGEKILDKVFDEYR